MTDQINEPLVEFGTGWAKIHFRRELTDQDRAHVRAAALPVPAGREEFGKLAGELQAAADRSGKEWFYWSLVDSAAKALGAAARSAVRCKEEIAKIIDPRAFDNLENYCRLMLADGKSEEQALKMAEYHWKLDCDAALAKASAILSLSGKAAAVVSIKKMDLSDGRADYFVSIKVGDREVTPHVFREEYKSAYHVALYDWLLNGTGDEPDCVEFGPDDWPARARSYEPVSDERAIDLARRLKDHLTTEEAAVAIMEYATDAIEQIRREETSRNEHQAETLRLMDILRSQEADSVTLCSDNPDFNGQPNCLVICNGDWTGWEDRRFQADTVLDALRAAAIEYRQKNSDGGLSPGNANVGDRIGRNRRPAHPMDTISGGPIGPSDPQYSADSVGDLLRRLRDYLDINRKPGNDLNPKFSAEITAALATFTEPQTPKLPCPVCGNEAIHAVDILQRTVIREPLAWDANENRRYEPVETRAKEIYDGFVYDGPEGTTKPAWTPGGNGLKQDEARFAARRELRAAGHSPEA